MTTDSRVDNTLVVDGYSERAGRSSEFPSVLVPRQDGSGEVDKPSGQLELRRWVIGGEVGEVAVNGWGLFMDSASRQGDIYFSPGERAKLVSQLRAVTNSLGPEHHSNPALRAATAASALVDIANNATIYDKALQQHLLTIARSIRAITYMEGRKRKLKKVTQQQLDSIAASVCTVISVVELN
jgi:hypothetical protein